MMNINEFILKYREVDQHGNMTMIRNPCVVCKDGFTFSGQSSGTHYSNPKGYADEYTEIEIGFPSAHDTLIEKYAENSWDDEPDYTDTVYGYVPVEIVDQLIEKHGGIDEDAVIERMKEVA